MKRILLLVLAAITAAFLMGGADANELYTEAAWSDCGQPVCIADTFPTDPLFPSQYGPQIIRTPTAWDVTTGSPETIIAVIDTGIDCSHPDLVGKCVNGYNAITDLPIAPDANSDDHGHGTHVGSTAAGATNNAIGVAGICWHCRIMPVKVLDSGGGGEWLTLAEGIRWATDNGADIINMSLGGSLADPTVDSAVNYAYASGVIVISACGNSGSEPCLYPASFQNSMAVTCTTNTDARCSFSSQGLEADVAAPGSGILAAVPTGACSLCDPSGYKLLSGTSMSTPHVAGVAGLIRSLHPEYTVEQVWGLLQQSADDKGTVGFDRQFGFGRVNAFRAVTEPAPDFRLPKPPPVPSVNDDFPGISFTSADLPYSLTLSDVDNTNQVGEQSLACAGSLMQNTAWWSFTNTTAEPQAVVLTTASTRYVAIYNGDVLGQLAGLACESVQENFHYLTFMAVPGVTYRFQVGYWTRGTYTFKASLLQPLLPKPTPAPSGATPVSSTPTFTPTPTPTIVPTPTATASPTAAPTPTPTVTPNCSPQRWNPSAWKCVGPKK